MKPFDLDRKPFLLDFDGTGVDLEQRTDPAFYVYGNANHNYVASVSYKNNPRINIYCDGEMRINLWDSVEARDRNEEPHVVVRYSDQLERAGITCDSELYQATERTEWINNTWFDLYSEDESIGDYGWINCVTHSLGDAISSAMNFLIEEYGETNE